MLSVHNLTKRFGGFTAVDQVSFEVSRGEILGLIGPNGSGKSTTFNVLAGLYAPSEGEIVLNGRSIGGMTPNEVCRLGLARTFQTTTLFPEFSVVEHVLTACHSAFDASPLSSILRFAAARQEEHAQRQKALELAEFVGLGELSHAPVASLSSAQQRLLMIATALASDPKLILLDEPAAGMVAIERKALSQLIFNIRARGVAVLVIEHHMGLIMEVCERIVVLNFGEKIAEGSPEAIRTNPAVIDAYLGSQH